MEFITKFVILASGRAVSSHLAVSDPRLNITIHPCQTCLCVYVTRPAGSGAAGPGRAGLPHNFAIWSANSQPIGRAERPDERPTSAASPKEVIRGCCGLPNKAWSVIRRASSKTHKSGGKEYNFFAPVHIRRESILRRHWE